MPSFVGGNLGLEWGFAQHEDGWDDEFNDNHVKLDALVQLSVIDTLTAPPGSPGDEARYIVGTPATGAWTGQENKIAIYTRAYEANIRDWVFLTPKVGWRAWHVGDAGWVRYSGSAWVADTDPLFDITAPAEGDIVRHDGTAFVNVRPLRGFSFGGDPTATLNADQIVFYHRFEFPFTIPADFGDYLGASTTVGGTANATADTVFVIQKAANATPLTFANVGTLTVGIGTINLTDKDSSAVDIEFAKGDVVMILAPTSPDATFAGVSGTLVGYEPAP